MFITVNNIVYNSIYQYVSIVNNGIWRERYFRFLSLCFATIDSANIQHKKAFVKSFG